MEILREHVIYVIIFRDNTHIESSISDTTHAMDVGALTPFLGLRRARKTNEFYERVSVHVCTLHIFALEASLLIPIGLLNDIIIFYYIFKEVK